jgi:hypothetical protein
MKDFRENNIATNQRGTSLHLKVSLFLHKKPINKEIFVVKTPL